MKAIAATDDLVVVEFNKENDVFDGWVEGTYDTDQEVLLKMLIYVDHIELHSATMKHHGEECGGAFYTKKHVRRFYYPDMFAMNETIKRICQGELY